MTGNKSFTFKLTRVMRILHVKRKLMKVVAATIAAIIKHCHYYRYKCALLAIVNVAVIDTTDTAICLLAILTPVAIDITVSIIATADAIIAITGDVVLQIVTATVTNVDVTVIATITAMTVTVTTAIVMQLLLPLPL